MWVTFLHIYLYTNNGYVELHLQWGEEYSGDPRCIVETPDDTIVQHESGM